MKRFFLLCCLWPWAVAASTGPAGAEEPAPESDDRFLRQEQASKKPAAPDTARPKIKTIALAPGGPQMEFVWIEPGTFTMGSPPSEAGREPEEGPPHEVTISRGFYLGAFEITRQQWQWVMEPPLQESDGSVRQTPQQKAAPKSRLGARLPEPPLQIEAGLLHPISGISWEEVQVFIQRLNEAAGEDLYRLPTEAEWEYACRAGTARRWSFGDDKSLLDEHAFYQKSLEKRLAAYMAEPKEANPWGLYHMHGSLWEWVQDRYDGGYYLHSPSTDPQGPAKGRARVLRGGSYNDPAHALRSARRFGLLPTSRYPFVGARLVRNP